MVSSLSVSAVTSNGFGFIVVVQSCEHTFTRRYGIEFLRVILCVTRSILRPRQLFLEIQNLFDLPQKPASNLRRLKICLAVFAALFSQKHGFVPTVKSGGVLLLNLTVVRRRLAWAVVKFLRQGCADFMQPFQTVVVLCFHACSSNCCGVTSAGVRKPSNPLTR